MAEDIAVENGGISKFEGHVSLTLTLDRVILHTVVHHSSTSTFYMPNFTHIKETFCGRTDVRTGMFYFGMGYRQRPPVAQRRIGARNTGVTINRATVTVFVTV